MTDPLPVRMVFGKDGARVEYEENAVTHHNAPLRELIAEIDRPLWCSAAHTRLDELEAVVKAARSLVSRMKDYDWKPGEYDNLVAALAKVGEERAK